MGEEEVSNYLTYLAVNRNLFSCCAISQPLLTLEEDRVAEIYADYVSLQLLVALCSEHNKAKNYQAAFDQWFEKIMRILHQDGLC